MMIEVISEEKCYTKCFLIYTIGKMFDVSEYVASNDFEFRRESRGATSNTCGILMVSCCNGCNKMRLSKPGNNYILTMVDYFAKWTMAVSLPNKSSETVASEPRIFFLFIYFFANGFPDLHRGREFVIATMDVLKNRTGAVYKISSAYPHTVSLRDLIGHYREC
jgi:hypothetical protein